MRTTLYRCFLTPHAAGILCGQFAISAASVLTTVLLVRALEIDGANTVLALLATAMAGAALSDFGLRNAVFGEVACLEGTALRSYVATVYVWRTALGTVVFSLLGLYVFLLLDQPPAIAVLVGLMGANMYPADPAVQVLRGRSLGHLDALLTAIDRGGVLLVIASLFVVKHENIALILAAFVTIGLIRLALGLYFVQRRVVRLELPLPGIDLQQVFVHRLAPGLVLLFSVLRLKLPVLLAPHIGLSSDVALIAVILSLPQVLITVPTLISRVVFPFAFRAHSRSPDDEGLQLRQTASGSILAGSLIGVLAAGILWYLAPSVLRLIRPQFQEYQHLLRIAVLSIPFTCMNHSIRLYATAGSEANRVLWSGGLGLGASLIAIVGFSQLYGLTGAVIGYVLSECTALLFTLVAFRPGVRLCNCA